MANFPYYTEPTHDQGKVTVESGNAARTTTVSSAEGRLIVDAVDKIFLLEPNKHPLVSLLTNVGKVWDGKAWTGQGMMKASTGNPEFKWFEDVYGGRYARASAAAALGDGTIYVTGAGSSSAYIFTVGDVIRIARTGENLLVTAIAGVNSLTVTRAFGTTSAAAIAAGDGIFIVGNVNEENSGARTVNTTRASAQTNYTQIFKTSIAVSNTEKSSNLYGGKDLPYQRAKKGTEHALDIEKAFWFGQKKLDTTGTQGHARRATGGIDEFITSGSSYVQNQGGPITAPDMNTFLREAFTYGNSTKLMFAGGIVLQAINEIARGQITTKTGDTTYGIRISEWQTPFGVINLVHNPLFVEDYAGAAYLLDMECFRYRFMEGRDTKLETNIQAPDVDGEVDQYITEAGLERKQAPRHAILKGVSA
ncbi:MAG: DUF5309 family protein [Bacteroidales bacterium]|jgi:hypothetical protein